MFGTPTIENAGEADDRRTALTREVTECVQDKGKVSFRFGREHASRCKAFVIDQSGIVRTNPFQRIRRIGDDGIKGNVFPEMGIFERVAQLDVELVVVDVVQKQVHPGQVVGGVVDFLPIEAIFNEVSIEVFLGLQQQ